MAVAVLLQQLDQPREPGMRRDELARPALEQRAPFVRDTVRVLEVLLEQRARVARVQSVDVMHCHRLCCTNRDPSRGGLSLLSRAGGRSTRQAPCRRRSRPLRPRSRARRAGGAGPRSPRRSARARARPGSALPAGRQARSGWRRSRAQPAGPRSPPPGGDTGLRLRAHRAHRRAARPDRPALRPAPRPWPAALRRPRGLRLGAVRLRGGAYGLWRLRLRLDRPVDDEAEVRDRDLQDQHHEDQLPHDRWSVRDAAAAQALAERHGGGGCVMRTRLRFLRETC